MGYGSLTTSNVKLIISAQDKATDVLQKVKSSIEKLPKTPGKIFDDEMLAIGEEMKLRKVAELFSKIADMKTKISRAMLAEDKSQGYIRQAKLAEEYYKKKLKNKQLDKDEIVASSTKLAFAQKLVREHTKRSQATMNQVGAMRKELELLEKEYQKTQAITAQEMILLDLKKRLQNIPLFGTKALADIEAAKKKALELYEAQKKTLASKAPQQKATGGGFSQYYQFAKFKGAELLNASSYQFKMAMLNAKAAIIKAAQNISQGAQYLRANWVDIRDKVKQLSDALYKPMKEIGMAGGVGMATGMSGAYGFKRTLDQYGDFERNMLTTQAKTGMDQEGYDRLTQMARSYAASTSWDPQQVSSVMVELASGGFSQKGIESSFSSIMDYARAVGQDDAMWATRGVAQILSSFKVDTNDSKAVMTVMDKMAAAINNSRLREETLRELMKQVGPMVLDKKGTLDDALAFAGVIANSGIDGSVAGTAIKNFLVRSGDKADYMQQFGISVYDEEGTRKPLQNLLIDIGRARKLMNDVERDAFDKEVFGNRSAAGINALIESLFDKDGGIEKLYGAIADSEGYVVRTRERMESGAFGMIKRIESAWQDMILSIGQALEPFLKEFADKAIGWINYIKGLLESNPKLIQWFAQGLVLLIEISAVLLSISGIYWMCYAPLRLTVGLMTVMPTLWTGVVSVVKVLYLLIGGILKFMFVLPIKLAFSIGQLGTIQAICAGLLAGVWIFIAALAIIGTIGSKIGTILGTMFQGGDLKKGFELLWKDFYITAVVNLKSVIIAVGNMVRMLVKGIVDSIIFIARKVVGVFSSSAEKAMKKWDFLKQEDYMQWSVKGLGLDESIAEQQKVHDEVEAYRKETNDQQKLKFGDADALGQEVNLPMPDIVESMITGREDKREQLEADFEKYVLPYDPDAFMPYNLDKLEKNVNEAKKKYEKEIKAKEASDKKEEKRREKLEADFEKYVRPYEPDTFMPYNLDQLEKLIDEAKKKYADEIKHDKLKKDGTLNRQAEETRNLKAIFSESDDFWGTFKRNQENLRKAIESQGKEDKNGEKQVELLGDLVSINEDIRDNFSLGFEGV